MKKNIKGFTLIEILLALSIFSIIAVTLYTTFASGIKLNEKSLGLNKIYREARWALDKVAIDLENMVSYDFSSSYPESHPFEGSENQLRLLLPTSSGLKMVRYFLKDPEYGRIFKTVMGQKTSKNVSVVTRYEEKNKLKHFARQEILLADYLQSGFGEENAEDIEVLSAHIKEDGLHFFYTKKESEANTEPQWQKEWKEPELPTGVRIELTFVDTQTNKPLVLQKDIFIPISIFNAPQLEQGGTTPLTP